VRPMKGILQVTVIAATLALASLVGTPVAGANGGSISIGGAGTCSGLPAWSYNYPFQYYGPYCRVVYWGNAWYVRGFHAYTWSGQYAGWVECRQAFGIPEECYAGYWRP